MVDLKEVMFAELKAERLDGKLTKMLVGKLDHLSDHLMADMLDQLMVGRLVGMLAEL